MAADDRTDPVDQKYVGKVCLLITMLTLAWHFASLSLQSIINSPSIISQQHIIYNYVSTDKKNSPEFKQWCRLVIRPPCCWNTEISIEDAWTQESYNQWRKYCSSIPGLITLEMIFAYFTRWLICRGSH